MTMSSCHNLEATLVKTTLHILRHHLGCTPQSVHDQPDLMTDLSSCWYVVAYLGDHAHQASSYQPDSQAVTLAAHTRLQASSLRHKTQLVHLINSIGHLMSTLVPARDSYVMGPSDSHDAHRPQTS